MRIKKIESIIKEVFPNKYEWSVPLSKIMSTSPRIRKLIDSSISFFRKVKF